MAGSSALAGYLPGDVQDLVSELLQKLCESKAGRFAAGSLCLAAAYKLLLMPRQRRTLDYFDNKSSKFLALRRKHFPPGFPNTWHAVCNAADVANGQVKSISALGTELVAFRGADGKVAVLDAFCPHMGAHLGSGGQVVGNSIRCPFHGWDFDRHGQCQRIPYTTRLTEEIRKSAQTRAYETREVLGRIFIWFDAEGRPPQWEMEAGKDLEDSLAAGDSYVVVMRRTEFHQHCCEMHMNSADPYHFQTLHAPLPIPGFGWMIKGIHSIKTTYGEGELFGKVEKRGHLTLFREKTMGMYLFGKKRWPLPFSESIASMIDTIVTFEGPTMMHFRLVTPLGTIRQVKTILPIEPFKQQVEMYWYAERSVPRIIAYLLSLIGKFAVEQDREVWENKLYWKNPVVVEGDGPFMDFFEWYNQFYSENSAKIRRSQYEL